MVYYNPLSKNDLLKIFYGLANWTKHPLGFDMASDYLSDLETICNNLDKLIYHFPTSNVQHKQYGDYLHRYRRNKSTSWYIIYNKDEYSNIFIQRIFSNHITENANQ